MNSPSLLIGALQAAAMLLTTVRGNAALPPAVAEQAVNVAGNIVQIVDQAQAHIDFTVPKNDSIWPNVKDLMQAPYLAAQGKWVPLGAAVTLVPEDTSFGDINHDGFDDAATIVRRPDANGTQQYYLAALLNQSGIMFNVADLALGSSFALSSHSISNGTIYLNGKPYQLWGIELNAR